MKITQYVLMAFIGIVGAIATPAQAFTITSEQQYKVDAEHTLFITHFSFNILNRDVLVPLTISATTTTGTTLLLTDEQTVKNGLLLTDATIKDGHYAISAGTNQSFVLITLVQHRTTAPNKLFFSTPVFMSKEPDRKSIIFTNQK